MPYGYKDNRLVALTETDKNEGRFVRISELELAAQIPYLPPHFRHPWRAADQQSVRGWMKGFNHEVL